MKQLVVAVVLSLCGCSFVLTQGPAAHEKTGQVYPECTTSMTWPAVDGVVGALMILGAVGETSRGPDDNVMDADDPSRGEAITSALLFAALYGTSAYIGYRRVSACNDARATFMQKNPQGVQPYGYPQPQQPVYQGPYPGYEGGVCYQGNVCAAGLVCASGLCVRPPSQSVPAPAPAPQPAPAPVSP